MGTDVHMILEAKTWDGRYVAHPVPDTLQNRNYRLFAVLGNVRNGYGFAGVTTHQPIVPISDNRGYPEDVSDFVREWFDDRFYDEEDNLVDIIFGYSGDHSLSYVTLTELINYELPSSIISGVVEEEVYLKWKEEGTDQPDGWCGSVSGQNIITMEEEEYQSTFGYLNDLERNGKQVYIKCCWEVEHFIHPETWQKLINWMSAYLSDWMSGDNEPSTDDVRLIFNFDS